MDERNIYSRLVSVCFCSRCLFLSLLYPEGAGERGAEGGSWGGGREDRGVRISLCLPLSVYISRRRRRRRSTHRLVRSPPLAPPSPIPLVALALCSRAVVGGRVTIRGPQVRLAYYSVALSALCVRFRRSSEAKGFKALLSIPQGWHSSRRRGSSRARFSPFSIYR